MNVNHTPAEFKALREQHGVSQDVVAARAGTSQALISHYELHKRRLSERTRERVWRALDHLIQQKQAADAERAIGRQFINAAINNEVAL